MIHRYNIKPHERGFLFKNGDLVAVERRVTRDLIAKVEKGGRAAALPLFHPLVAVDIFDVVRDEATG